MKHLILALLASSFAAHAQQDEGWVAAERARLAKDRARVEAEFKAEEKVCYSKFAVNDCLAAAKSKRRQATGALRRQEIALNDAERKRKAMERSAATEQKLDAAAPAAPPSPGAAASTPAPGSTPARAPANPDPGRAPRANDRSAAAKAAQQEKEVQRRRAEADDERQRRAQTAEQRKREHEERVEQARQREETLRQRLAERKKPPASSLQDPR